MKKIFLFAFAFSLVFSVETFAQTNSVYFAYNGASSLKSELNSINRQIERNEYKIKSIKNSKNLSENQKRSKINSLESQNRSLKRKSTKIKNDYRRAISWFINKFFVKFVHFL